ncbi:AzlD domain-containing protein [Pararhodobacter zhoushanensis]|uniref:AzlD domain-containing protein n=1 Tax=Pararhodobacter zhoushanensis TaxID=2479545 RepID=UPI003CCC80EE
MIMSNGTIWLVIVLLGLGTFALRLSFLGLIGNRPLPAWALRLLRYTPVAVIPGLMAPQIFRLQPDTGLPDPVLLTTVGVTLVVGLWTKNAIWAMVGGAVVLTTLTLIGA